MVNRTVRTSVKVRCRKDLSDREKVTETRGKRQKKKN